MFKIFGAAAKSARLPMIEFKIFGAAAKVRVHPNDFKIFAGGQQFNLKCGRAIGREARDRVMAERMFTGARRASE